MPARSAPALDRSDPPWSRNAVAAATAGTRPLTSIGGRESGHGVVGPVPGALRERRLPRDSAGDSLWWPALAAAMALHGAGAALVLLIGLSLVPPTPFPAIEVSLVFEPAHRSEASAAAARESVAADEPAPPPSDVTLPSLPPIDAALVEAVPLPSEPPPPSIERSPEAEEAPQPPRPPVVAKPRLPPPPARRPLVSRAAPPAPTSRETEIAGVASPAGAPQADATIPATSERLAMALVVPPRPVGLVSGNRKPDYPTAARNRGLQGKVVLRVDVAATGAAISVAIAASSGHPILDAAAAAAVKTWRFSPATQAGIPIVGVADVPIQFRMED